MRLVYICQHLSSHPKILLCTELIELWSNSPHINCDVIDISEGFKQLTFVLHCGLVNLELYITHLHLPQHWILRFSWDSNYKPMKHSPLLLNKRWEGIYYIISYMRFKCPASSTEIRDLTTHPSYSNQTFILEEIIFHYWFKVNLFKNLTSPECIYRTPFLFQQLKSIFHHKNWIKIS